ncbi:MAG: peptidylprolyl isomerase [Bacilli bacterium]|nr:peptidylprolyl isomerase [Bacilli bacterium]
MVEEILEGTVDGYKFKVTDEVTDRVKIQMNNGDIMLVVLSNQDSPITIANFKKLVSEHFYDGLIFHRVIEDFMIQTGDPNGTGMSGSEDTIKGEFKLNGVNNNLSHTRGVISMARRGGNPETADTMNSASSQFFIVHQDSTFLDGNYAAFGRVFAGLNVIDKIANVDTDSNDKPLKAQTIKSIRFITIEEA